MANGRTGRLFDPVRTGSQQPAPLRFRTFNSRLVRGSTPPSRDKWPKRWTFGQKQGHLFRLRRGIEPISVLLPDQLVPALGRCGRFSWGIGFFDNGSRCIARHAVGHLPVQGRLQLKTQVADQHQMRNLFAFAFGAILKNVNGQRRRFSNVLGSEVAASLGIERLANVLVGGYELPVDAE